MYYIHTERVKNLTVSWTYYEDRLIDKVYFVDKSSIPFARTIVSPKNLRYSLAKSPIEFALSLYKSYYLQKSFEKSCLK